MDSTQRFVTGQVKVKLYKGHCTVAGMTSPMSLYQSSLASFTMGMDYDPTDAKGFIRLFGLPMRLTGMVSRQLKRPVVRTS